MMIRPTLVFVHGAWHGSWAWEPVTTILQERGWSTAAVDLPSVHAADFETKTLADDAAAVEAAVAAVDGPVVVVAHSYGGVPTTQAALDDRVVHVVFISAFVLDEGESLLAAVGGVAPGWWVVDGDVVSAGTTQEPPLVLFFGDVDRATADASARRLKTQARRPFVDQVTQVSWRDRPTTYVITEQDYVFPLPAQEALAARSESRAVRLPSSHSPFLSQPEAVADIVEEAAAG